MDTKNGVGTVGDGKLGKGELSSGQEVKKGWG